MIGHFRAIWPVLDHHIPLTDLTDEAWPELNDLAHRSRYTIAGRPRWCIRPGSDVAGSGGAALVLVADVPVAPIPADVDAITGEHVEVRGVA